MLRVADNDQMSQPKLLGIHHPSMLQPGCKKKKKKKKTNHATIKKSYIKKIKIKKLHRPHQFLQQLLKEIDIQQCNFTIIDEKIVKIKSDPISIENAISFYFDRNFYFSKCMAYDFGRSCE